MRFLDRLRKKGAIIGSIIIRDLPAHHSFIAYLAFTRVPAKDSPFPADDRGAPFHKCDYIAPIKGANDPETQPFTFKLEEPIGFYYLILRVIMARPIRDKMTFQIENFSLSEGPVEIRHNGTVTANGSVTWPGIQDDNLHEYGRLEDLIRGDA
jgi:hypothetical protein